ncbi:MAG: hypothetical protein ABI999_16835, partial [Acidobacteriota bacterium]
MTDIRRKRYDATELKRLYLEEKLTTTDLALRFRVYPMTICRWLEKTGIDRRRRGSPGESIPDQTGREKKIRATPMGEMGQFKKNHARFRRKQKAELEKRRRLKVQRHHETDRFRE